MSVATSTDPQVRREVQELSLLFEISQALDRSIDLREVVGPLLTAMSTHMGMIRGTITLVNRESGEIQIEAAHGLSPQQRQKGRYRVGEGVTGKVVATGKPALIPHIYEDPSFLDRTGARANLEPEDISFLCVPIKLGNEVIGALSVDRLFSSEASLHEDLRLLSVIANMISQAVRLRQTALEEHERLREENERLHSKLRDRFQPSNIIGRSKAMLDVYDLLAQVCKTNTTVLIRGERGTGKELVANAIHYNSLRSKKPFVKVSCAALPQSLIESELFGHEKGAFTGATHQRKGRFELAHGGTIFLDEVGDLSPATQVKLLRVLQEREFERVGGIDPLKADLRVIAATNRDLEEAISAGTFRADLYDRLNVFPIHVPPLRERGSDVLLLANHFAERFSSENHKSIKRISTPAIDMLMSYHWPGNVRELESCIERAVIVSIDDVIHGHYLPPTLQTAEASGTIHKGTLTESLDSLERELIVEALKNSRGNKARAARDLGVSERLMGLRVKKYGISPKRFKAKA
ncbi:MAG: sigma 54-interacting transcriptional regulator [Desulfarculaceae bacterium]